jgi:hypothetical protein
MIQAVEEVIIREAEEADAPFLAWALQESDRGHVELNRPGSGCVHMAVGACSGPADLLEVTQ